MAPPETDVMTAYEDAADPVSLREERGQVETARRWLERVERLLPPGDVVDLGCWTGSFLVAARDRGWNPVGIEPSDWAGRRARERGLDVRTVSLFEHGLPPESFQLVVLCDVLEHLIDPRTAAQTVLELIRPGGGLFLTVPDAGSWTARMLGRRWWSVLPMHLQYFSRDTLRRLLEGAGFEVRWMHTHPKVFSALYYAERLGGYSSGVGKVASAALNRAGLADHLVAPDFRDRLAVLAVRRSS
jgi:SAM-dependent methyltransferase